MRQLAPYPMTLRGETRRHLIFRPEMGKPSPLLIALHPGQSNPRSMAKISGFHELGEREGFAVIYPQGSGRRQRRSWVASESDARLMNRDPDEDRDFLCHLLDELLVDGRIDPERVYVTGFSQGAAMSYSFAEAAADKIAAIAPVSGTFEAHTPHQDIPAMHIHGERDRQVPPDGGAGRFTRKGRSWPAAAEALSAWSGSDGTEKRSVPDATEISFGDRPARLLLLKRSGHRWCAADRTWWERLFGIPAKNSFQTTDEIWEFLSQHRRAGQD